MTATNRLCRVEWCERGKRGSVMPGIGRQTFQFAVARLLLPSARGRMVRHQQFDQSVARRLHLSVAVFTVMSASTGECRKRHKRAAPTSTTQTRHTPTGFSFCWWHSVGMGMPLMRAASKMVVPAGPRPPAVDGQLNFGGVVNSCRPSCLADADANGTAPVRQVLAQLLRGNVSGQIGWERVRLAQAADGSQLQRVESSSSNCRSGSEARPSRPSREHLHHLLRTHAAGYTLAAGFVADKSAPRSAPCPACSGLRHRPRLLPSQPWNLPPLAHSSRGEDRPWSGQVSGRRARRRETKQLPPVEHATRIFVDQLRILRAHRDFVNPRPVHVAADAYELHARRDPFVPCALNQSTPRTRITVAKANVSTLLIAVGWFHRPFVPGKGGLLRGSARLPSIASSNALSSPQIYPPGLTKISRSKAEIAAQNVRAQQLPRGSNARFLPAESLSDSRIRAGCREFRAARP